MKMTNNFIIYKLIYLCNCYLYVFIIEWIKNNENFHYTQTSGLIFLNLSLMSDSDSDESVGSLASTSADIVELTSDMIMEKLDLLSEKRYDGDILF